MSINSSLNVTSLSRTARSLLYLARRSSSSIPDAASTDKTQLSSSVPEQVVLPKEAEVVVIGGGSVGCSTLYHLAKIGVTNTVLLEAHQLTAGTTWHTAGLIWTLRPNDTEIQLLLKTKEVLAILEDETGVNPGWIENGGLFVASNRERLNEYKRLHTLGKAMNIESYILGPEETKKLYPLMNVSDVYGTLYCPKNGTIDPAGLCTALTRYASRKGAKIVENCSVEGIKTKDAPLGGKQVTEVQTTLGNIKTNCIVNATGCWANDISSLIGTTVPIVPLRHAYVVTEKIPGIEHMPNVRDHDSSLYLRLQGDALSVGGYEKNPIFIDELSKTFAFSLYELDWDVFNVQIEGGVNRIPALESTGIKSTVCGPESFTPDHKPIMGEDPNVIGFYHCVGFNSAGMMLGGGCGHQMAQWVTEGRPDLDMFGYDIRRFHGPLNSNKSWVNERSHESYAKNYSIVFPHDEPLAGRNQRRSPLHDVLANHGCVFQERHGWERPGWFNEVPSPVQPYDWYGCYEFNLNKDRRYTSALEADYTFDFSPVHRKIREACIACRTEACLFDMSYFGQFFLSGPDAQAAADWLFSADVRKKPGSVVYTCMLKENGGTEADLTVTILEEGKGLKSDPAFTGKGFYLAVGGAAALQNWAHLLKEIRKHNWNVQLTDKSDSMALLSLQGPYSKNILEEVAEGDVKFTNEAFPFSSHRVITIAGHEVHAIRLSFVGELGWEFHMPNEAALPVYTALYNAGKPYNLTDAGYRAMDSLSAEKGYKHWHADLRSDDTPLEAGLGFACKLKTDIPFLGRAALETQKEEGLRKKLVTLTLDDVTPPLWGLETICRDGTIVGFIRRAEFAHALGKSIAYGYVSDPSGKAISKEFLTTGVWEIEVLGERRPCTLHTRHPFDPKNLRLKGEYTEEEQKKVLRAFNDSRIPSPDKTV